MNIEKEDVKIDSICELLKKCKVDDGSFTESLYNLYFYIGITKGVNDIQNGNGTPLEDFKKEREALYERYHRRYG
jgi:hypothetical protein